MSTVSVHRLPHLEPAQVNGTADNEQRSKTYRLSPMGMVLAVGMAVAFYTHEAGVQKP